MILDAHSHELDAHRERIEREERHRFEIDDAQGTALSNLDARLDHMQERFNEQGARIRHLEHQIKRVEALPGVSEALAESDRNPDEA